MTIPDPPNPDSPERTRVVWYPPPPPPDPVLAAALEAAAFPRDPAPAVVVTVDET